MKRIKSIIDAGIKMIPHYDNDGKIMKIEEIATGTKSYELYHTFEIVENGWSHYIKKQGRITAYVLENGLLDMRYKNFEENTRYYHTNGLLTMIEFNSHPDNVMKEEIQYEDGKMTRILLYDANQNIESREITSTEHPNFFKQLPFELQAIMF